MTEDKKLIEATCPECRGPLTEIRHDDISEYRCLVGHRYSARGVLQAHSEAQEKALWAAVVALEEAANLARAVSDQFPAEPVNQRCLLTALTHQPVDRSGVVRMPYAIGGQQRHQRCDPRALSHRRLRRPSAILALRSVQPA